MPNIRIEYWVPVKCVTEMDAADVEEILRAEPAQAQPASIVAGRIARCEPVSGPCRQTGQGQAHDDDSDLGVLARGIQVNAVLLDLPVPFDKESRRSGPLDVRIFLAAPTAW